MPSGDSDLFDDQVEDSLAAGEVEFVDAVGDGVGEFPDALAEPVVGGKLSAFDDELVTLGLDTCPPRSELIVPLGQLG